MEPYIETVILDFWKHFSINWLEERPPEIRRYQQVILASPVISEMKALVIIFQPFIEPCEVKLKKIVPQTVYFRRLKCQGYKKVLKTHKLLHLFKEYDPCSPGIIFITVPWHMSAVKPVFRNSGAEYLRPFEIIIIRKIRFYRIDNGDSAPSFDSHPPSCAPVIKMLSKLI